MRSMFSSREHCYQCVSEFNLKRWSLGEGTRPSSENALPKWTVLMSVLSAIVLRVSLGFLSQCVVMHAKDAGRARVSDGPVKQ